MWDQDDLELEGKGKERARDVSPTASQAWDEMMAEAQEMQVDPEADQDEDDHRKCFAFAFQDFAFTHPWSMHRCRYTFARRQRSGGEHD